MDRSGGVNILLVEDNPDHAEVTGKALEGDTAVKRVYWVKDGQEALDFLHHRDRWADHSSAPRPGLILLDIHLPKINGHDVLRQIKSHPDLRTIPVVMLTTSERQDEVAATYRAGANSFVTKPVNFGEFVEQVRSLKRYWTGTSRLPAAQPAARPNEPELWGMPKSGVAAPGRPRVLVVEDHQAAPLRRALEKAGMQVTAVASSGEALVAVTGAASFDVVITDVSFNGADREGVWLLNRLSEHFPDLPVVAVTGRAERAHELLELGFATVVIRPVTGTDDLIPIVRGVLRR
jgi:CheY-like chemotaxis protein